MAKYFIWSVVFVLTGLCSDYLIGLRQWDMTQYCSQTISTDDVAGELYFDANDLYTRRSGSECTVTIQPMIVYEDYTYHNKVLVNFTEFRLGQDCGIANLTLFDGSTTASSIVEKSAAHMCGVNETLVNQNVTLVANDGAITLRYTWTEEPGHYYGHSFPARFALKFNSFSTGDCETEQDVTQCSNGRCVRSDTYCTAEINGCGYNANECEQADDETITIEGILDNIIDILEHNVWIIVAIVGAVVFFQLLRKARRDPYSSLRKIPILNKLCPPPNNQDNTSLSLHDVAEIDRPYDPPDYQTQTQIERQSLTGSVSSADSRLAHRSTVDRDDNSPAFEPINTTAPAQSLPSAPPPAYDEVMAPSYNDVIANSDKYRHNE